MKNPLLLLRHLLLVLNCAAPLIAQSRDDLWQAYDKAEAERLPQSALAALEPIIAAAVADGADAETAKAVALKAIMETSIEGGLPQEAIRRLEAALEAAPPSTHPVLQALLANAYWSYFQQNRWRFLNRSQTAAEPGPDFETWDVARILEEISRRFDVALARPEQLQAIPIADYEALLKKGAAPDVYRPTLYDFIAHEALAFYRSGEQGATLGEDVFEPAADGPILDNADAFLAWELPEPGRYEPTLKAILLYQNLLRFHRNDSDRAAFFDADLSRLEFGLEASVGEEKEARYVAALERFIAAASEHEISARALALLAETQRDAGNAVAAHHTAQRGYEAFPESVGGAECYNIIQQIEAPSAQLATEFVWNAPWPTLDVSYRNATHIYLRAVPIDFAKAVQSSRWGGFRVDRDELLAADPALVWEAELPSTTDYQERTEKLAVPTTLAPGFYAIVSSFRPDFALADNFIAETQIWVSDLALVMAASGDEAVARGLVLDAGSGEPLSGAKVQTWVHPDNGSYQRGASGETDADGRFAIPLRRPRSTSVVVRAEYDGEAVSSIEPLWLYDRNGSDGAISQTTFFTDRALYRPGQTIRYKGIAFRSHPQKGEYETLANVAISLVLRDTNGREVTTTKARTNRYGSFSGSFTAPSGGLTGAMTIATVDGPMGSCSFSVEEYKRPKFIVTLDAPTEAPKLGESVSLTGRALAYTGAPIGGAKVSWRVEREARFPLWCWWWLPIPPQAIDHGVSETDGDGSFSVEFEATPDAAVARASEPIFTYTVYADVTDTSGETRSANLDTRAGYTALQANVTTDAWQTPGKPVAVQVSTATLDGALQSVAGTVSIYTLKEPETVQRKDLEPHRRWWRTPTPRPAYDPTNPDTWEQAEWVASEPFETDQSDSATVDFPLAAGVYRVELETQDRFGAPVTARSTVTVVAPEQQDFEIAIPSFVNVAQPTLEPGETLTALWGTGYESGRAFVEILQDGEPLQRYWTLPEQTQSLIKLPITESMRGGITLHVTFVHENRAYIESRPIDVPWSNKQLEVKWETFRSKLEPGQAETWTAIVSGPDQQPAAAEMVATLYDASLDQFLPHSWPSSVGAFRSEAFRWGHAVFQNGRRDFQPIYNGWRIDFKEFEWSYRRFPEELDLISEHEVMFSLAPDGGDGYVATSTLSGSRLQRPRRPNPMDVVVSADQYGDVAMKLEVAPEQERADSPPPPPPDLSQIAARQNLSETAFFFPHLESDESGLVKIQFTMPEALTQWRFLGFAHDTALRSGLLTDTAVTAKDLMVEPNPPRFLREGDEVEFTVKVTNQSDRPQAGRVRLTFADAASAENVDEALGNRANEKAFLIPAQRSRSFFWRIKIPDGAGVLTYKAVGATESLSDGEEGYLPVLSRRILVTESLPLPIRGKGAKTFAFDKLLASADSETLRSQTLTVQMVSQPAWYAVMALPYLMEFPHECSEQLFNRYYANQLAAHIANSNPKIRRVFDLWKNTPALDSPLAKNEELASLLLEETPWMRDAQKEGEARRNVGALFDANRLADESARALAKLAERQLEDGRWSWFPGGPGSDFMTLYIATGFGRLRHLGVKVDAAPAVRSLDALDDWMEQRYRDIQEAEKPEEYVLNSIDALYLYGRSFFIEDRPIANEYRPALDFFLQQGRSHWTKIGNRQSEGHVALALQRFGDRETPAAIARSLKERSMVSEELGRYWRDGEGSWWWYRAPIETQALMIEVFSEVARDDQAVEDCKVWLLKQKQTQAWPTTKATADAVYGLLLRGENLLASDALVEVALGGKTIEPEAVEAGTGFYAKTFVRDEIRPEMGEITVTKSDAGVSWGSVHWQYLEDMGKVMAHEGTPLTLKKSLWVKENSGRGQVLKPVTGPLAVGDELVVRLELRADRDMEFLHLKDQRGSGLEPVDVLSRYRYQDGLGYYQSTRDTASHFFFDHLRKGTYVFEYSTRIQLKGTYQSGIAEIQCMYAPEFNSHSESIAIVVE